jgi:hypothetical protein
MAEVIGAWEREAKIFLVDIKNDKEIFTFVLDKLVEENSAVTDVLNGCIAQINHAKQNLEKINNFFICMFIWDFDSQFYLPFTSPVFESSDVWLLNEIVKKFIDISIQCCSDGFEVKTFNDENKLLAYALQVTCENELMQFNLKQYKVNDADKK